jgi:hypothetical protein
MVCTPSGESSNREAVLSGFASTERFQHKTVPRNRGAVGNRHLIAATQLTSVFCRRLGGTPMVGDVLAVEVLDARDRGEWPFFLAQSIAFF